MMIKLLSIDSTEREAYVTSKDLLSERGEIKCNNIKHDIKRNNFDNVKNKN